MFLPNSHSFLLVRSVISKPVIQSGIFGIEESATSLSRLRESRIPPACPAGRLAAGPSSSDLGSDRKMFLPNSHSFSLIRSVKPVVQSDIEESETSSPSPLSEDSGNSTIGNKDKRTFLKVAGIAGAGLVGSLLLPKKADALIMGSSPTTGVVGIKNAANTRINPATEETLDEVLKTTDLTFDGDNNLKVSITSVSGEGSSSFSDSGDTARSALVDAQRHVQVDVLSSALPSSASTETTLQTIAFGGTQFALRLATVGDIDYGGKAAFNTLDSPASWQGANCVPPKAIVCSVVSVEADDGRAELKTST